jgi:glycosyltransferase, family 2
VDINANEKILDCKMIKTIYAIALLFIYRRCNLLWSYSFIARRYFKVPKTTYAIYALYKSGAIELDETAAFINKSFFVNGSLKKKLLSMHSPECYIDQLTYNEKLLIENNWRGINRYLQHFSLLPFVDSIPWKTFPVKKCSFIDSAEKVSIIMTVHNAAHTLNYSIDSILNQTYSNIELIIVDDFSTDESLPLLKKIAKSNNRVRLFTSTQNNGTYKSRNIALKYVTGSYITTHDADDLMHPQHIEIMVNEFKKNTKYKASISYWVRFDKNGVVSQKRGFPLLRLNLSSLMIKRDVLNDIPQWYEYICGSDLYYYSECLELYGRERVAIIKKPLSLSLISDSSLTVSKQTGIFSKEGRKLRSQYEDWWRRVLMKKYHPVTYNLMCFFEKKLRIEISNFRFNCKKSG